MNKSDYIIVGQGIAGTVLAYSLLKKGRSVTVIDDPTLSSCSRISAGNINPIVFKRLVKSWMADTVLPFATAFYRDAEKLFATELFLEKQVVKLFTEEQEKTFWKKKCAEGTAYVSDIFLDEFHNNELDNSMGAGVVNNAANVMVNEFIELTTIHLRKLKAVFPGTFDFQKLEIIDGEIKYNDLSAKRIIFCEGWKVMQNPYFSYLPLRPAKGEMLVVRIADLELEDKIVHKGIFILPLGNNLFKVGATYDWEELNDVPTEKAKEQLIEKVKKVLKVPFEVDGHLAGVRPAVEDRRPLIGMHPEHKSLGIFNGMGTKGVMLAPYFADQFIEHMENNAPLDHEVDIRRYYHFYKN